MTLMIRPFQRFVGAARRPAEATAQVSVNQNTFGWSSSNWSGYAASSTTPGAYDAISAEWEVPQVESQGSPKPTSLWGRFLQWLTSLFGGASGFSSAYSATWIGIDGFNDNSLIQTGTAQNIVNGQPQYYAWWETLPNPETPMNPKQYPVSSGDHIVATINRQSNGNWSVSMGNRTRGWVFQKTDIVYSGPQTSAEWIVEAPLVNGQIATLANYGEVTFTNCAQNGKDPYLQMSQSGVMVQGGQQISTPSAPNKSGDAFTLAYGSTQPSPPVA